MALHLIKADACFLHIPKTGGKWVEQALRAAGISTKPANAIPLVHQRHAARFQLQDTYRYYFCFVRHPAEWYASWWKFCQQPGAFVHDPRQWHPQNAIADCMSGDFAEFVNNVCDRWPDGYLNWMYAVYTGANIDGKFARVHWVGNTSRMAWDLCRFLRRMGYKIDQKAIESVRPYHVSPVPEKPPAWTPRLWRRVAKAEKPLIQSFGFGEPQYGTP